MAAAVALNNEYLYDVKERFQKVSKNNCGTDMSEMTERKHSAPVVKQKPLRLCIFMQAILFQKQMVVPQR